MVIPAASKSFSFKQKQSKFVSYFRKCDSEYDFKSWLSQVRKDHYDASHICWAYRIYENSQIQQHSSDAGEPSGTAGVPILRELKRNDFIQAGLAIARNFGGTKLGKRGLIDAYSDAAKLVIENTPVKEWINYEKYLLTFPINYFGDMSQAILGIGGKIIKDKSNIKARWVVEIKLGTLNKLIKAIRTLTKGEGDLEKI